MMESERAHIWIGLLKWIDKKKVTKDADTWLLPFMVSAATKNGEPEVKATSWPSTMNVLLMPKMLVDEIGQNHFENSKSVDFHPSQCSGRDHLINIMSTGYDAYLDFPSTPNCDIDVILLKLTDENQFIGIIPNDQEAFIERVIELVEPEKSRDEVAREPLRPALADTSNVASGGTSDSGTPTSGSSIRVSKLETYGKENQIPHNRESSWHQPQQVPQPIITVKSEYEVINVEPEDDTNYENKNMSCEPRHDPVQSNSSYDAFLNYLTVKNESGDEMNSEGNNQPQEEVQLLAIVNRENVPVKVEPMSETISREENLRKIGNLTTAHLTAQKNLAEAWSALSKTQGELQEAHNLELQFRQQNFNFNPFRF